MSINYLACRPNLAEAKMYERTVMGNTFWKKIGGQAQSHLKDSATIFMESFN